MNSAFNSIKQGLEEAVEYAENKKILCDRFILFWKNRIGTRLLSTKLEGAQWA